MFVETIMLHCYTERERDLHNNEREREIQERGMYYIERERER